MTQFKYLVMVILITLSLAACQPEDVKKVESIIGDIAGDDISQGNDVAPVNEEKFQEQSSPVEVTDADARNNARQSLKTGLIPAIKKMMNHLDSLENFLDDQSSSSTNSEPVAKAQKDAIHSLSKAFAKISTRMSDDTTAMDDISNEGDVPLDEDLTELTESFFTDILKFHHKDGNVIFYSVDPMVCENEFDGTLDAGCVKLVEKIRVIQKLNSSNSGIIALKYENFRPISIGYSSDEWFIQTNLAEVKATVEAVSKAAGISGNDELFIPSQFKGVIRITLKNIDANSMSAALGVLEPIVVKETGVVRVDVGKGKIIDIKVDEAAETFKVTVSSRAINAMFKETDEEGIETKMAFAITSITGEMVIDGTANTISINGFLLGEGGFVAKANDQDMLQVTASEVNALITLGDELTATNDVISVSSDLDVKLIHNLVTGVNETDFDPGETSNSIRVTAPASTAVEMMEIDVGTDTPIYHEVLKVTSGGPVNIVTTGEADAGEVDLLLNVCYDMDVDGAPEVVTCP